MNKRFVHVCFLLVIADSVCPLAIHENGGGDTVLVAGDGHIRGTDHKVDMDHAILYRRVKGIIEFYHRFPP